MVSREDFEQATKLCLCNSIAGTSVDTLSSLKKYAHLVDVMKELRDAADALAEHLDDAIVKASPCKYNVSTVENRIDGFRHLQIQEIFWSMWTQLGPYPEQPSG